MTTAKNFYSCSSSSSTNTDDASLLPADATQLSLSYQYEIETTSSSSTFEIEQAIERVQSAILFNIARQSGLLDCPTILAETTTTTTAIDIEKPQEKDESSLRRRQRRHRHLGGNDEIIIPTTQQQPWHGLRGLSESLQLLPLDRGRGRGSNSIVGLSSFPMDKALVDVPCHPPSLDAAKMARSNNSGTTNDELFSSAKRQVSPGMAGLVAMGKEKENVMIMDGKPVDSLNNAMAPRSSSNFQKLHEEETGAFNYISTQSKPKSSSTLHELHNPSIVSHEEFFQQHESPLPQQQPSSSASSTQSLTRTIDDNNYINSGNLNNSLRNKCTVVQGHMSIYTSTTTSSSSSFENLQGRILYAIGQSVNSNQLGLPNKNNQHDVIQAVRMHSDLPYANSRNNGRGDDVSSANSSTSNTAFNSNLAFLSNVPMIPVMIAMGVLLLAVLALFISTSRPNKRQKRLSNNSSDDVDDRGKQKEETATIMSVKTMDIDLDAGEELELQSTAISLRDEKDALKRNRSSGIGMMASGLRNVAARRQRSSGGGGGERGSGSDGPSDVNHGDDGGVGRMAKQVGVSPNNSNSLLYSSASLPSPSQTPLRSIKRTTTAPTSPGERSTRTPRTPKPVLRTVPRTPRAVTPDVEVELYDCLFPTTPATSCHSRNSILGTPNSSSRRGQQQQMVQKRSSAGGGPQSFLDMLATTFCTNPQYEDVEVCLRPVDDCAECVENEFFAPLAPTTPSSAKKVQTKERERERNQRVLSDTVPNYVFADDGDGVGSATYRDRRMKPEVHVPNYVFAEKGEVVGTPNKGQRIKSDSKRMKIREDEKKGGRGLLETFDSKFGETCSGGGGGARSKRRNRPDVNEISIEEIHEIYSRGNDGRRSSARTKDLPAKHTSDNRSNDGSVALYDPTTACTDNDNWFFSWW